MTKRLTEIVQAFIGYVDASLNIDGVVSDYADEMRDALKEAERLTDGEAR